MEIISSQPLLAALPPSAMAYPAQILPVMENLIFKSRKGSPSRCIRRVPSPWLLEKWILSQIG